MAPSTDSTVTVPSIPPSSIFVPIKTELVPIARAFAGIISTLVVISLTLLTVRLWTRMKSKIGLRIEDWFLILATALAITDWASVLFSSYRILPAPPALPLEYILNTAPLSVVSAVMSALSVAAIKTSVLLMLLRLQQGKTWRRVLQFLIGIQAATAVFITVLQTTKCVPLSSAWDLAIPGRCWGEDAFRTSLTTGAAVTIATDVICSIIPVTFLRTLNRPLRERIIIGLLMGLGLVASAASVVKTVVVQQYSHHSDKIDRVDGGLKIALWSNIEEQVGIIAACVPCLRAPFRRFLLRLGITTTRATTVPPFYLTPVATHRLTKVKTNSFQFYGDAHNNQEYHMKSLGSSELSLAEDIFNDRKSIP